MTSLMELTLPNLIGYVAVGVIWKVSEESPAAFSGPVPRALVSCSKLMFWLQRPRRRLGSAKASSFGYPGGWLCRHPVLSRARALGSRRWQRSTA